MAVKIVRTNDEQINIKDGYRVVEEYNKIIVYDGQASQLARFQSEEVKEWWVDNEESTEAGT